MSEQIPAYDESVNLFDLEPQIDGEAPTKVPPASDEYLQYPKPPEGEPFAVLHGERISAAQVCSSPAFVRGMARLRHERKHPR